MRDALWSAVEANKDLKESEKEQLYHLLLAYKDTFAHNQADLGRTDRVQHEVRTDYAYPIRQRVLRTAPAQREETRKLIEEMLHKDIIQPSSSPWASPVVLVRKKDGSARFCVDYRRVNSVTNKDAYPLPRVYDTDTLAGSQVFTTLDLISGYWQVEVKPEDREKTAFCTSEGLFEFKVMPFGLCNAPATFQRLMDAVLIGLQWSRCLVYLDDVVVPSKSFEDHLQNLKYVLDRFRSAGLKLNLSKCKFGRREVTFLGHVVSAQGVAADPAKLSKVASWPQPQSQRDVQQFLGFASYYRRFIKDFAVIARPLHHLTRRLLSLTGRRSVKHHFRSCVSSWCHHQYWPSLTIPEVSSWIRMQATLELVVCYLRRSKTVRSMSLPMAVACSQNRKGSTVSQGGSYWQWCTSLNNCDPTFLENILPSVLTMDH